MDGILIKVQETVSVKIFLEGLVFNQKFVIAVEITAEAIVGMDFLEANRCVLDLCRGELVAKHVGMIPLWPHSSSKQSQECNIKFCNEMSSSQNCIKFHTFNNLMYGVYLVKCDSLPGAEEGGQIR